MRRKKNKGISLLIALVTVLQMLIPANFAYADTGNDETSNVKLINGSILIRDKGGSLLFDSSSSDTPPIIPADAKIKMTYEFLLEEGDNVKYEAGDWFTYTLPDKIIFNGVTNKSFETSSGGTKGTFTLSGNTVTVTFTDVTESNITVELDVEGIFDKANIKDGDEIDIDLGYTGGIIRIGFKEPPKPNVNINAQKTGVYENGEILWTINVTPSALASNVTVEDIFSNNQDFVAGSLKVNGVTTDAAITGSPFTYVLGDISTPQAITYKTKPKDGVMFTEEGTNSTNKKVVFDNKATVFVDGDKKTEVPEKVELDWIQKSGREIEVSGFSGVRIEWTVKVNNYGGILDGKNAKIVDELNNKLKLVEDGDHRPSIKFDNNSKAYLTTSFTSNGHYTYLGDDLTYFFDSASGFKTAVFTYYTDVEDPSKTNNNNAITFSNKATLLWDSMIKGPSDTTTSTGIGKGIIKKDGVTKFDYVKGSKDIIEWTVTINRNGVTINDAVFRDDLPTGLEYVAGSFSVAGLDTDKLTVTKSTTGTSIKYELGTINTKIVITYKTKIVDGAKVIFDNGGKGSDGNGSSGTAAFKNSAYLFGEGILNKEAKTDYTQLVGSSVIDKTAGNYNYETGRIKWNIVVNKNKMSLKDAVLKDVIPEGMIYDDSTFNIDKDVPHTKEFNETEKTLQVTFSGTITDTYTITFETVVDKTFLLKDENLNKSDVKFTNKSTLTVPGLGEAKANATVKMNNYIVEKEKSGISEYGDYIEWFVPINANRTTLTAIEISDALQDELELDLSSVKLYKAKVNPGTGKLTKEGSKLDDDMYDVTYENNVFTLKIHGTTSDAYILEFTTDVLKKSVNVKNTITFKGSGKIAQDKVEDFSVSVDEASVRANGGTGTLKVLKLDEQDNKLTGAKFKIYWKFNGIAQAPTKEGTIVVAEDGVLFDKLLYKTYYIEELEPPSGYLKDTNIHSVRISKEDKDKVYEFLNKKAIADIEFTKFGHGNIPLSGVEFTLYEGENPIGEPVTSDSNGKVVFKDIGEGVYTIRETFTPNGYETLTGNINAVVQRNSDKTAMEVIFEGGTPNAPFIINNNLIDIPVQIAIKKTGIDGALKDAEFGIYDGDVLIKTAKSDDKGEVVFTSIAVIGMDVKNYVIKEIGAPDGYLKSSDEVVVTVRRNSEKLDEAIVTYNIDENPIAAPEINNEPINIKFIKKDNHDSVLDGAEFTLYDSEGKEVQKTSSNALGEVEFKAVPAGTYTIKETQAPSGYRDYKGVITAVVEVNEEGTAATVTFSVDGTPVEGDLTVTNERRPGGGGTTVYGKIAIKKVDESRKVLAGAEFTLYDSNGKVVGKAVTGADGIVYFENLEKGTYVIKETKAPEGYVLNTDETDVEIKGSETKTFTFTNKKEEPKKPGRVEIIKTDENGKALSGARFALVDDKGATLQTVDTVNGRAVFEDVPVGKYTVKEVQAPEGYELSTRTISVAVESEKTVTVRYENRLKPTTPVDPNNPVVPEGSKTGSISIIKVDEKSMALPGAEFTLYNEDNQIVGTAASDISGKVMFENLKEGKYYVEETNAPEGYALVDDVLVVDITETKIYSYRFKNVPESLLIEEPNVPLGWETIDEPDVPKDTTKPGDKLPDTGSIFNTWLLAVIGFILILAGVFMYRRRILS